LNATAFKFTLLLLLWPVLQSNAAPVFALHPGCQQVVLGLADTWNSANATLQRWERTDSSEPWHKVGDPWPVRLGKNGLAWGRGLHPENLPGPVKQEGDGRAPCGVFLIGDAFGYAPEIEKNPVLTYHQVTEQDLWVEDSHSPDYNRHLQLPGRAPATDWERKQQMRLNDPAHSLKLFIAHNAWPGARPGCGSAIFFHIWREDGAKPSTGCSVMAEPKLRELVAWVDPTANPVYVLLPRAVYQQFHSAWLLP